MTLANQIYAQAFLLAGSLDPSQETLLHILCHSAETTVASKLRPGITPKDCTGDFVAAASLYALAAFSETDGAMEPDSFQAGNLAIHKKNSSTAANCLRRQAELMMAPYFKDHFSFLRV